MNRTSRNPLIEEYFSKFDSQLSDVPRQQREDFVRELRAHVMERVAQSTAPDDKACRSILQALGAPEEIARQYRLEFIMRKPSWRMSPITVLRAVLRWALSGVQGFVVFCVALIGYALSLGLAVATIFKPFFPRNIGVFVSSHNLIVARFPDPPAGRDVLGLFFIPVAPVTAYILAVFTTWLIKKINQRSRRLRQRL